MQRLEVSGAVRPLYGSLGVKGLNKTMALFNTPTAPQLTVPPCTSTLFSSEVENEWKYSFNSHTPPAHAHGNITFVCTSTFSLFVGLFLTPSNSPHLLGSCTSFTFSAPCIVIHRREKDQKDAHFFLSQFIYPLQYQSFTYSPTDALLAVLRNNVKIYIEK